MVPGFSAGWHRYGDRPALLFRDRAPISYSELETRVARLAEELLADKSLVAVEAAPSEHAVVAYLAALRAGHAVALLPPDDRATADWFAEQFRPDLFYRKVDDRWRFDENATTSSSEPLHPDLALILLTSGSTGQGKAVRLSAAALQANATAIAQFLELDSADRAALSLPLHYSYGLSVLNSHLAVGASVYLPGVSILDPAFLDGIRDARCTNFSGVPHSYELLEAAGFRNGSFPDLRFMTVAGGRMPVEQVRRCDKHLRAAGKRFYVMYGQTEATARIAYVPPDLLSANPDRIGVAIPGGELAVLDEHKQPAAAETVGELTYRGPNVMMGYAQCREDLSRGSEVDLLRTGDLAIRDAAGLYRIVGRLSRMSKIAGIRIGHDALEASLAARGIGAAVVGDDRTLLAAYVSGQSAEQVRTALAADARLGPAAHKGGAA